MAENTHKKHIIFFLPDDARLSFLFQLTSRNRNVDAKYEYE